MQNISIIVAMANNRAIGRDNKLLWHLPNDLKYFKAVTMGKPIVMGRKTFESIGKPLPGRDNIVITSNSKWPADKELRNNSSLKIFNSIDSVLEYCVTANYPEVMVIGGGEIYKSFLNIANKIYLTLVDTELDADVFFPDVGLDWQEVSCKYFPKDQKHKYDYSFIELVKK